MERHIRIRNRITSQIDAILTFAKNIDDVITENAIRPRIDDLVKLHDDFNDTEISLAEFEGYQPITTKVDLTYYEARALLEDALFKRTGANTRKYKVADELNETLDTFVTQQRTFYEALNTTSTAKLPKITIEPFSGEYKMWTSFRDLYVNAVHNHPNLKGSQKLQQLKSLLRGEAAGLIRHITTTDQNYEEAWQKLEVRYNKPKPITSTLIQTFLEQKPCKTTNYKDLRRLYDQSDEIIRALRSLGNAEESRDPWLIHLLLQKVDNDTKQLWARESVNNIHPKFSEFLEFLNVRCDTLESCVIQDRKNYVTPSSSKSFLVEQTGEATPRDTCCACKGDHFLFKCPSFRNSSLEDRIQLVNEYGLCRNCLRKGHIALKCYSKTSCLICKRKHHSLLHQRSNNDSSQQTPSNAHSVFIEQPKLNHPSTISQPSTLPITQHSHATQEQHSTSLAKPIPAIQLTTENTPTQNCLLSSNNYLQSSTSILLPTAIVKVKSRSGEFVQARVLLDSGSQCSFATESLIKRLGLIRSKSNLKIIGLAASAVGSTRGRATLVIQSKWNQNYTIIITSQIMKSISSNLPETSFSLQSYDQLKQLELADPKFNEAGPVDILIGAEHFFDIIGNQRLHIPGLPPLYNSQLGWLVAGSMNSEKHVDCNISLMVKSLKVENEDLNELLKRFWEVEEPSIQSESRSNLDYCEQLYSTETVKTKNNRFEVRLPFVSPRLTLGSSYFIAKSRLLAMERKFMRNKEFYEQYKCFMKEYCQLNHMERVDWTQIPKEDDKRYFIPHHGVYKESSSTTKLRVVFDASAKTSNSVSLNDIMHVGPKIQSDLFEILLRFRMHQIVFVGDIEKMYRQILVSDNDCNYQLVLWRDDKSKEIDIYKLRTVTYGMNCSPFLAVRTLQQIALDNAIQHPNACKAILHDFYVDDLLSGADSEEAALKLKDEIVSLLDKHGFHLRKWRSNSQQIIKSFSDIESTMEQKLLEEDQIVKTLGLRWDANTDTFSFQTKLVEIDEWTKRKILSEVSKLYDPFGWLAPTVILFKMIIQKLWVSQLDWDSPVSLELNDEFQVIYKGLTYLNNITIQRSYHKFNQSKLKDVQIHAFSDASEKAYGAVVYLRATGIDGIISTEIICAKTKVAPIRQICLPRLELCGAYILSKLIKHLKSCIFKEVPTEVYAWCDSSIVLHWLADIPRRWKTFIANRTSYILDVIPTQHWRHINGKENPADLLSRGVLPDRLCQMKLWWKGPPWLIQHSSTWPVKYIPMTNLNPTILEQRANTLFCVNQNVSTSIINNLFNSCSSYLKVKRCLVFVMRFCRVSTGEKVKMSGPIQIKELVQAENHIVRFIQAQNFNEELTCIRKGEAIKSKSKLKAFDIFMDENGILRVGGRLKNSNLNYSSKHPIILPKSHPVNDLIIKELHHSLLHGGLTLVLNTLRLKFWMINARNNIKQFIKNCVVCIRFRAESGCPRMGDLPAERVTETRVFRNSGVDYAGPIYIKTSKLRKAPMTKAYIAVFVCLAIKAVHLEVVSSLDTESFIAALRRFIARRGLPALICCDNGSNFVSANSELKLLNKQLTQQQNSNNVIDFCSQKNIEFRFNPPSAPHFGGLWEATVKSVKFHLRRVAKDSNFTFEELTTMITQIEAILNSRPLCRLHDSPDDLQILTPGHFLIGEPMMSIPEPNYDQIPDNKANIWQNIQKRVQGFWKTWHRDYLNTLTQRMKWCKEGPTFNIDDVVLLKDENLPPARWMLGRIIAVFPGKDEIVRVVKIKTKQTELIRPVVKLIKLPIGKD